MYLPTCTMYIIMTWTWAADDVSIIPLHKIKKHNIQSAQPVFTIHDILLYYILAQSRARATAMISLSIRRTALGLPKAIVSGNEEGGESSLSFTMCIIYIRIHIYILPVRLHYSCIV